MKRGGAQPEPRWTRRSTAVGAAAVVVWAYHQPVVAYLRDQHYQEHFLYLWGLFALALTRTLRGPFRSRFEPRAGRDQAALVLACGSALLLWLAAAGGSSTGQRSSLAGLLLALALVVVPAWSWQKCLQHSALVLLCFGMPYSLYFPLTKHLQWGVAKLLDLAGQWGEFGYQVAGAVVVFPHYRLAITADCSGVGQLLTFLGIAALGVLTAAPNPRRTLVAGLLAVALAWLSNLARVATFTTLVGLGWTAAVDWPTLHAGIGFAVFLPFVTTLVWYLLQTHRPLPPSTEPLAPAGRWSLGWLLLPTLLAGTWSGRATPPLPEPAYFAELTAPPAHRLQVRAPSEAQDRVGYDTPWLLNARFVAAEGDWFDLFHYATRSRSHLCVHTIADCLDAPGSEPSYLGPVDVDGLPWWRLGIEGPDGARQHVYFAFEVGNRRHDDSWRTAWQVFARRLVTQDDTVRLWRVTFPGPVPAVPNPTEERVLRWLGELSRKANGP
ncbi:MAG: exosortase/archaeosortase family protein [Planctomycetes bacterium]|nr:exosortase/archaeosortase family protein [Planctomycetota bacterium]